MSPKTKYQYGSAYTTREERFSIDVYFAPGLMVILSFGTIIYLLASDLFEPIFFLVAFCESVIGFVAYRKMIKGHPWRWPVMIIGWIPAIGFFYPNNDIVPSIIGHSFSFWLSAFFISRALYIYKHKSRYEKNKDDKVKNEVAKVKFKLRLPKYLPEGFAESERTAHNYGAYSEVYITYINSNNDTILIGESDGQLYYFEPLDKPQTTVETISGREVVFSQEVLKPTSKSTRLGDIPCVQATWSDDEVNFAIDSDYLSLSEIRQVVKSMIPSVKRSKRATLD